MKRDDGGPWEVKPPLMVEPKDERADVSLPGKPSDVSPGVQKIRQAGASIRVVLAVVGALVSGGIVLLRFIHSNHGVGEFVMEASECRTGKMLQRSNGFRVGGVCTSDCTNDAACDAKFRCREGNCVRRGTVAFGGECDAPWDCESYLCLVPDPTLAAFGAEAKAPREPSYCSQPCSDSNPCPAEHVCSQVGGESVCVKSGPDDGPADIAELMRRLNELQRQAAPASPPAANTP